MPEIEFFEDFEDNNWNKWDTAPSGSNLTISTSANYGGAYGGLGDCETSGDDQASVTDTTFDITSTVARLGCRFNLNNVTMDDGQILAVLDLKNDAFGLVMRLAMESDSGSIYLSGVFYDDANSETTIQSSAPITTGWVAAEIVYRQANNDTASDGSYDFLIDGVSQGGVAGIDNYDAYENFGNEYTLDLNAAEIAGGATSTGEYYIDNITLSSEDAPIFPSGNIYALAVAADAEQATDVLYITLWKDDGLYLQKWDGAAMTGTAEISLGSASLAQVQDRTYAAYPFCGSDSNMWVFGRMDSPAFLTGTAHLIETDGGGASGSWFRPSGLESWNDSDVLQSLHVTPPLNEAGDRTFTGVRWQSDAMPELWRGLNQMALQIAIPFPTGTGVNYQGMDVSLIDEVAVGNTNVGAGTQRILSIFEPFTDWGDITYDFPSGTVDVLRFF